MTKYNPNGVVVYEGSSLLDDQPIVIIMTGIKQNSRNSKTGTMLQTYVLRRDMSPAEALATGQDVSICGNCVHRGDGTGKNRSCYVVLRHGPRAVYGAYQRGCYEKVTLSQVSEIVSDRMVRLGAYGDPGVVPIEVLKACTKGAAGHTGYTHQWKTIDREYAKYCMASVDSIEEMHQAHQMGYRTFRVSPKANDNVKGLEVVCPASGEAGRKTSCYDCKACMGTSAKAKVSIQIAAHGIGKKHVKEIIYA